MESNVFQSQSLPKAYFKLSLPVVFSMVITIVYNITDTYFIALTQNTDLVAGVSLPSARRCLRYSWPSAISSAREEAASSAACWGSRKRRARTGSARSASMSPSLSALLWER